MPNRKITKVTVPAFTKMEARVEALETTIADVQRTMAENHATLIAMMEKCLGKSVNLGENSAEFRHSIKRVELPACDGDDPPGWISRAEGRRRSNMGGFDRGVVGEVWRTWRGRLYEQLSKLKQEGTGYFLHGLKMEINGRVRSLVAMGEMSRSKLMQVTLAVEKEFMGRNGSGSKHRNGSRYNGSQRIWPNKDRSDWMMVKKDVEDEGEEMKILAVEVDDDGRDEKGEMSILNLHHIAHETHHTMKFQGEIYGVEVLILVDSGATHNFISQKLVHQMDWSIETTPHMNVKLGNGFQVTTQGVCIGLEVCIGDFKINPTMHLFDLGGIDVVLGIEWLQTLGDTITNWRQQIMSFWCDKKWVTLKGQGGYRRTAVALHSILNRPKPNAEPNVIWEATKVKSKGGTDSNLNKQQQYELEELLNKHDAIFQIPTELPPKRSRDHAINLVEGQGAVNVRPYRYPHHHKNEIERQANEMLATGVIRHSKSSFSSPVILVKKKGETWRMCIDYRALNKVTIPNKFPIPVIEELLDELYGAKFFSKLDLKSGYHQVRVKESDIEKTAFRTHEGHYEFMVMPFGLMNAPSTFQSLMNDIFCPLLRKSVLVFFDDILIYSKDWKSHIYHLNEVLQLLSDHSLVANKKKCFFGQTIVDYLGQLITAEGVAVDPGKVVSVLHWPQPKNVKGVRGFLGLTGYYMKFIKDYGKIARPLTELTKKDAFKWGIEAQRAFDELKGKLTTAPVLALPDFSKQFFIECDASGEGLGAILMQDKRPIAYFRRKFIVSTDQKSLKQLLQQRIVTTEQQNWTAKLLGYVFEIVYKQGKLNKGADALSRIHEGEIVSQDPQTWPGYTYRNGVLLYNGRLVISSKSLLMPTLLEEFHSSPQGRHSGFYKTYRRLAANVYWVGIKNIVQEHVRRCDVCQRQKYMATSPGGLLQPLPIPEQIWEDISMDFITGLPKSKGYEAILEIIRLHGIPLTIVSDRDPIFISSFWKELFKMQGTKLQMSTSYHPETDGQTEVFNTTFHASTEKTPFEVVYGRPPPVITRCYKRVLASKSGNLRYLVASSRCSEASQTEQVFWRALASISRFPSLALAAATKPRNCCSVFVAVRIPPPNHPKRIPVLKKMFSLGDKHVMRGLVDRDEALRQLRTQLLTAQEKMKNRADRKRSDRSFVCGEWVFVKLRSHRQQSVVTRINVKLVARFYQEDEELPELMEEYTDLFEPEAVLAARKVTHQNEEVKQVLVQWKGRTADEATWEDEIVIRSQFPSFDLEDKVSSEGGGMDRSQLTNRDLPREQMIHYDSNGSHTWLVYSRRKCKKGND
ncbi:hypothetical protein TSUD_56650 [Trifolium subterraneum]|uniref:Ty3/gypsy retrotransposon protein n=1 Tax=Trifolium subterraneum TaxID=3900 RepID=A0A2Z6MTH8_TRISU|nr:hypothetical protein TSUD_56650 [Trifolium subterraneum]